MTNPTVIIILISYVAKRGEMIAHLKDQLQEMKAKTTMESKYIKKVFWIYLYLI